MPPLHTIPLVALPIGRNSQFRFGAQVDPSDPDANDDSNTLEVVQAEKINPEKQKLLQGEVVGTEKAGLFGKNTTLILVSGAVSLVFIVTAVVVSIALAPKAPSPPSPPSPPPPLSPPFAPSPSGPPSGPPPQPPSQPPYPYGLNVSAVLSGDVNSFNMQNYDSNITAITGAHSVQSVVLSGSISVNSFLGYYVVEDAQSAYAVLTTSSYTFLGNRLGYTVESIDVAAYGFDSPVVSTCPTWPPSSKITTCSLVGGCGGAMLGGYKITTNSVLSTPKRVVCSLPSY